MCSYTVVPASCHPKECCNSKVTKTLPNGPAFLLVHCRLSCEHGERQTIFDCRQKLDNGAHNSSARNSEGTEGAERVCEEAQDCAEGLRQAVPVDDLKALRDVGFEAEATRHVINHADVRYALHCWACSCNTSDASEGLKGCFTALS